MVITITIINTLISLILIPKTNDNVPQALEGGVIREEAMEAASNQGQSLVSAEYLGISQVEENELLGICFISYLLVGDLGEPSEQGNPNHFLIIFLLLVQLFVFLLLLDLFLLQLPLLHSTAGQEEGSTWPLLLQDINSVTLLKPGISIEFADRSQTKIIAFVKSQGSNNQTFQNFWEFSMRTL